MLGGQSSVTVPNGATSATFDVATTRVAVTTDIIITARAGGITRTAPLRLRIDPAGLTPSVNHTIGFSALRENRAAVTIYTESGFAIAPISPQWVAITNWPCSGIHSGTSCGLRIRVRTCRLIV